MLSYNEIYESLRKERYADALQSLNKDFVRDFAFYLQELRQQVVNDELMMDDNKAKKQIENSIALFKELILRRKKKLANLVLVATETGIMKRDYENMLDFEKELFDKLVKNFEESDKILDAIIKGKNEKKINSQQMIVFTEGVEQFVDMFGNVVGPFQSGDLANLEKEVVSVLVSGGKARLIDEH